MVKSINLNLVCSQAISVWVSLGYLIFLMCSQKYMVKRSAINLEKPLVAWNGLLTLFSMLGTAKTSSEFFHSVTQLGFGGSICVVGDFYRGKKKYL